MATQAAVYPVPKLAAGPRHARRPAPAMVPATLIILVGLGATYGLASDATTANGVFSTAAFTIGVTLALSFFVDCRGALVRLIRVDLFMMFALYGLTFFEFLFDQPAIIRITAESAKTALLASIAGFAGIAVGRHLVPIKRGLPHPQSLGFSPGLIFQLLLLSSLLGYFYMLLAVNFNPIEMVEQMMRPRFSQPWTRGRLGGMGALLSELSLMKAAIPALCGVILAQRKRCSVGKVVVAGFLGLFVLFDGFSSGTRSVFLLYFITFLAAYFVYSPRVSSINLVLIGAACAIAAFFAMVFMLETRGNLQQATQIDLQLGEQAVFVDMNMLNVAQLIEVFPARYAHLGFEIPYNMVIRPIPRALWPGKPEGLSLGIEEALGVGDFMTLSATFIGEFWMAGGWLGVVLGSLALGSITGWWNRFAARADTQLKIMIYLVGFFPAGLCMRSFLSVAPAVLPVITLFVLNGFLAKKRAERNRPSSYITK